MFQLRRMLGCAITRTIASVNCKIPAYVHTSAKQRDLMEFFDEAKNWGKKEVRVGRAWNRQELRIKSNDDLHKLWFVLLKERNMLLTMEHECREQYRVFPNPERIDKVEEAMENVQWVVRERNEAYHRLETGESGERPAKFVKDAIGLNRYYKMLEHKIPERLNSGWRNKVRFYRQNKDGHEFINKYRELCYVDRKRRINRERNHILQLIKRFANLDVAYVKELYPDVDVDKLMDNKRSRGHFIRH